MRFYCNINENPRALVAGLGSNIGVNGVEVKRRDAGDIELQLFSGVQGGAVPVRLAEAFEMRFTCKVVDDWDGDAVVLEQSFEWRPTEQVYRARPNFNTTELNALFDPADEGEEEPSEVVLMAEFTWRELDDPDKWTSTATFTLTVANDVNRGDEGDPTSAADPTIYATKAELAVGYVKTNVAQTLTTEQKAQARGNIGAIADADVVKVVAQTLTPTQQEQARDNIGAVAAAEVETLADDVAALAEELDGKASGASVTALTDSVSALDAVALKKTAQSLSDSQKAQVRTNIGAAPLASERVFTRLPVTFNPVGSGTTVSLDGALNAVTGTAVSRPVAVVDAGQTITSFSGAVITKNAHGGVNDQPCQFTGTLIPAGVVAGPFYFLRDVTTNTFSVAETVGGAAITLSGSFTGWKVHLTVGPFFRQRRVGYRSAATAGASCGTRHNALQWAVSGDEAMGRWTLCARFGVSDAAAVANARLFVGMVGRDAAAVLPNGNPSSLVNLVGVGADTGDANLQILHNGWSGGATKVDLGSGFPANTRNADVYEVVLRCNADASVTYKVTNLTTDAVAQGNLVADLPGPFQLLAPQIWRNNGSTALAVGMDVMGWTLESAA